LARHRHRGLDSDPPAVHHSSSQSPYFNPRRSLTAIAYRTAQTSSAGEEKQRFSSSGKQPPRCSSALELARRRFGSVNSCGRPPERSTNGAGAEAVGRCSARRLMRRGGGGAGQARQDLRYYYCFFPASPALFSLHYYSSDFEFVEATHLEPGPVSGFRFAASLVRSLAAADRGATCDPCTPTTLRRNFLGSPLLRPHPLLPSGINQSWLCLRPPL
jgi:hypothetical protein